jgi:hypothetical protein
MKLCSHPTWTRRKRPCESSVKFENLRKEKQVISVGSADVFKVKDCEELLHRVTNGAMVLFDVGMLLFGDTVCSC